MNFLTLHLKYRILTLDLSETTQVPQDFDKMSEVYAISKYQLYIQTGKNGINKLLSNFYCQFHFRQIFEYI